MGLYSLSDCPKRRSLKKMALKDRDVT